MKKIAIFGFGGHASEIIDICDALGYEDIVLLVLPSETPEPSSSFKYLKEEDIPTLQKEGYSFAIGMADGKIRHKIYKKYNELNYPALIHPDTSFGKRQLQVVENTPGTIVAAGTRFMSSIQLGKFCVFGLNCTVGHDSIFEDYVSVMPGVNISGNVHIKKFGYIGSGAVVLQGTNKKKITLNEGLVVGAGAVVTKSFNTGSVIAGVPAVVKS